MPSGTAGSTRQTRSGRRPGSRPGSGGGRRKGVGDDGDGGARGYRPLRGGTGLGPVRGPLGRGDRLRDLRGLSGLGAAADPGAGARADGALAGAGPAPPRGAGGARLRGGKRGPAGGPVPGRPRGGRGARPRAGEEGADGAQAGGGQAVRKHYEAHDYANLFPMMTPAELEALTEDVRESGLRQPVVLYQGKVLDGRNRLLACEAAGVEPTFITFEG